MGDLPDLSMFHGLLVGSSPSGQLLDDTQIRVALELGEFFAEQRQTRQTAEWLREQLRGSDKVQVSCEDMRDDASAALELVTAFGLLVSSSEFRSHMRKEVFVSVSYGWSAAHVNTAYRLVLSYENLPQTSYTMVIKVSDIAMTMGGKLSEELAKVVRERGGTDYCLSFDAYPFFANASQAGAHAIEIFRAEQPSVLPKRLMLLLKEERQRHINVRNAKIHASHVSNADICDLMQHTLLLDPDKPFSANPGALEILLDSPEQKALFTTKCIEHNAFFSVVDGNLEHSSLIPITLTEDDREGDGVPHGAHFQTNLEPIIQSVAKLHLDKTICNMLRRVCKSACKLGSFELGQDGHLRVMFDGCAGPWLSEDVCRHVLTLELKSCTSIVREQARRAMDHVPIGPDVIIID
jgi:hypothetical protein